MKYHIEMELPRMVRVRPPWSLMAGRSLEGNTRRRLVSEITTQVFTSMCHGQGQERGIEGGKRGGIGAVDDNMEKTPDHEFVSAPFLEPEDRPTPACAARVVRRKLGLKSGWPLNPIRSSW